MAQSSAFKNYARGPRQMLTESGFASGMMYTDNPLSEDYVKLLVNYDYKDGGVALTPRGGYRATKTVTLPASALERAPILAGVTKYDVVDTGALVTEQRARFICVAPIASEVYHAATYAAGRHCTRYNVFQTLLYLLNPETDTFVQSTLCSVLPTASTAHTAAAIDSDTGLLNFLGDGYQDTQIVHGFPLSANGPGRVTSTSFNGKLYMPAFDKNNNLVYAKLTVCQKAGAYYHTIETVQPFTATISEVLSTGYNMLQTSPYTFANTASTAYVIEGIIPYDKPSTDASRKVMLSAKKGSTVYFDMIYRYPATGEFVVKWEFWDLNADNDWTVLQVAKLTADENFPGAAPSPKYTVGNTVSLAYTPNVDQFQLRCSIYTVSGTTVATAPTKVMLLPVYNLTNSSASTKNLEPKTWKLMTCVGLLAWKKRMLLWGVTGAETAIWMSDVNDPTYFPYPNNVTMLDEDVVHIVEYLDGLLAFTASKIYQLTLNADGLGFTTTLIQDRLSISPEDKHVVQVIKNMIYFKSDNYFYMTVPKMNSIRQELTIAPITKPVSNFFDGFETAIRSALGTLYFSDISNAYSLTLLGFANYVDNTIVRNVYTFRCQPTADTIIPFTTFNFKFVLNYDTALRVWTTYCYQCNGVMLPYKQTITDSTTLIDVCGNTLSLLQANPLSAEDSFDLLVTPRRFKNYQLIDTGYREHSSQYKKRYRELQLKINNTSAERIQFYSEFLIDDDVRKTYQKYETRHITDPADANYGSFFVERVSELTWKLPGTTLLADTEADLNTWLLDFSMFPDLTSVKVRMPVSGKGYNGRFKLISYNERLYELLSVNWVFRILYAR